MKQVMKNVKKTYGQTQYPQHEKLKKAQAKAICLSGFLDWLEEEEFYVCKLGHFDEELFPVWDTKENIIGEFLGIDPVELEKEKLQMFGEIQAQATGETK